MITLLLWKSTKQFVSMRNPLESQYWIVIVDFAGKYFAAFSMGRKK